MLAIFSICIAVLTIKKIYADFSNLVDLFSKWWKLQNFI